MLHKFKSAKTIVFASIWAAVIGTAAVIVLGSCKQDIPTGSGGGGKKKVSVTAVMLDITELNLVKGTKAKLTATVSPENAENKKIIWSSSNPKAAEVDQEGNVTAKKEGQTVIVVRAEDGGKPAVCMITVTDTFVPVAGVFLDETSLSLVKGTSRKLTATVLPANATNKKVRWSSTSYFAEVDQEGNVTAKEIGTGTIYVYTESGNKSAECTVTITETAQAVTGVTLPPYLTLVQGDNSRLIAAIEPENATNKKVSWSSNKAEVADVDEEGNVTAKAIGEAEITVTTEDGGKTAKCTVNVIKGAFLSPRPDKLTIKIKAVSKDGSNIAVNGCSETEIESGQEAVLNVQGIKVALIGDITELSCDGNSLISLNVQSLTDLTKLKCQNNELTSLDVQGLTALTEIECFNNLLTSLDVQGLTALTKLYCSNNRLTSLDVQGLTALTELNCHSNQLTSLNIQGATTLQTLICTRNQLTSLDVQGATALAALNCSENQLTSLDVQGATALINLDCSRNQLTSLEVQGTTALNSLNCFNNQLTSLDVQGATALQELNCNDNQLTSLDVQSLTALAFLQCNNNQLTSINVQGLTKLWWLECNGNQLTSLDVQGLTILQTLYCSNNQLTSLEVQGTTALNSLNCFNNQLNKEAFTKLFNDLTDRSSSYSGAITVYTEKTGVTEGNYKEFTDEELKAAKDKNWDTRKVNTEGKFVYL